MTIEADAFRGRCTELILWRDGHKAVVTLTIAGRAVRVLEADCREMFYEAADAGQIRGLSRETVLAMFDWRSNGKRPAPELREAAE